MNIGMFIKKEKKEKISIYKLKMLKSLHFRPINVMVYYDFKKTYFKESFPFRCIQWLSLINVATRRCFG